MSFVQTDGGRAAAGFVGGAGDCVTRAIAIVTGQLYRVIYDGLHQQALQDTGYMRTLERRYGERGARRQASPRDGVHRRVYDEYLDGLGWEWVPTMHIGQGCTVHLRANELPGGNLIARLSKHVCAVVDGVVHDTFDPSREGTRCVYGYFQPRSS